MNGWGASDEATALIKILSIQRGFKVDLSKSRFSCQMLKMSDHLFTYALAHKPG